MAEHFISYSSVDGKDFAFRLHDALLTGQPPYRSWLDRYRLGPGYWTAQVIEALRECESLLFVMTPDSVMEQSVCAGEWALASQYRKPIIPLRFHREVEAPFLLRNRQQVDFTGDFETGLARLRLFLAELKTPQGLLRLSRDHLADAERALPRAADEGERLRIQAEIDRLRKEIAEQQRYLADPAAAEQRAEECIAEAIKEERRAPQQAPAAKPSKFINQPPMAPPRYFQDRVDETNSLVSFLGDDSKRLLWIDGRGGVGKTTIVCRLLRSLASGELSAAGPANVDSIICLSPGRNTVDDLYHNLCGVLEENVADQLKRAYAKSPAGIAEKMRALLEKFTQRSVLVLLDGFEDHIDPATHNIKDGELKEALEALLKLPHHSVKVILTSRLTPPSLVYVEPGRQTPLPVKGGLPAEFAKKMLLALDEESPVGLRNEPPELLEEAVELTGGNPKALEMLRAALAHGGTSLREILEVTKQLPDPVMDVLVGEAFSRLDPTAQRVMQALAVYSRAGDSQSFPVNAAAVDFLLQPYMPGLVSQPVLRRLADMRLARKAEERYCLDRLEADYAFGRVPADEAEAGAAQPPFTQAALLRRAAEYFRLVRTPPEDYKSLADLRPQLAEINLRVAVRDYDEAARVLLEIDHKYLHKWGLYRQMLDLHQRLERKLTDSLLEHISVSNAGAAYFWLGKYREAISYYQRGLAIARQTNNRRGEGICLRWLGNCRLALGEAREAEQLLEEALGIARETGDKNREAKCLNNLGGVYMKEGQSAAGIRCFEQALQISRDLGDKALESDHLGNLGSLYSSVGEPDLALRYIEQALELYRANGDRTGEAYALFNIAHVLIEQGDYAGAARSATESARIGEETGSPVVSCYATLNLASALLLAGRLSEARDAALAAACYDEPDLRHLAQTLLGLARLRLGEKAEARAAFAAAVEGSKAMIALSPRNYNALESLGLALCGLALSEDVRHKAEAVEAYRGARRITRDVGIVRHAQRMFGVLGPADPIGILGDVAAAVEGSDLAPPPPAPPGPGSDAPRP